MSIVEVKVPQLSESVAEATLLQWKKKPGEAVAADEILIEVETDKVVLEVPAPAAGVLAEIVAGDGATVTAEQLIARIDTEGKAGAAAPAAAPAAAAPAPAGTAPGFAPGARPPTTRATKVLGRPKSTMASARRSAMSSPAAYEVASSCAKAVQPRYRSKVA